MANSEQQAETTPRAAAVRPWVHFLSRSLVAEQSIGPCILPDLNSTPEYWAWPADLAVHAPPLSRDTRAAVLAEAEVPA